MLSSNYFDIHNPAAQIIVNNVPVHTHLPNDQILLRKEVTSEIKDKIVDHPTLPVKRVYNEFVAREQQQQNPRQHLPVFQSITSTMNRKRKTLVLPIPANIRAINIQGEWATTWRGERFLICLNQGIGVAVFATDDDCRQLARCDSIFIDGTFRRAPAPFVQFIIILGRFNNHILKYACALLTTKEERAYTAVFVMIKNNLLGLTGQVLAPNGIVMDFEISLLNASRAVFPGAHLQDCFFIFLRVSIERYLYLDSLDHTSKTLA